MSNEDVQKLAQLREYVVGQYKIQLDDPNNPIALSLMGLVACFDGEKEIALEFMTEAISIEPDVPELHENLGILHKNLCFSDLIYQNIIFIKK